MTETTTATGYVHIAGAGPGDPGLLTQRAARALERSDVVIHDDLVSPEVLALARHDVWLIRTGKRAGHATHTQDEITALLIEHARAGRIVTRLKGGDPFVFGRGAEEAVALRAAGIDFDIIPGVSSGIAGPAYAGIPVTHRDFASSVLFVTAHESEEKRRASIDWNAVARAAETIVVFMGAKRLAAVAAKLIAAGRHSATPVAVIRWATTLDQETYTGTLGDFAGARAGDRWSLAIGPPAIAIIGDVVRLRSELRWFADVDWAFAPQPSAGVPATGATTRPGAPVRHFDPWEVPV